MLLGFEQYVTFSSRVVTVTKTPGFPATLVATCAGLRFTFIGYLISQNSITVLPSISSEFNRSNEASWLGTSCVNMPVFGQRAR